MASAKERAQAGYVQCELDAAVLAAAEAKRERRRARNLNEPGWLRRAQEAAAEAKSRFAGKGPVSNLPVPDGDAERVTAAELAEDEAVS